MTIKPAVLAKIKPYLRPIDLDRYSGGAAFYLPEDAPEEIKAICNRLNNDYRNMCKEDLYPIGDPTMQGIDGNEIKPLVADAIGTILDILGDCMRQDGTMDAGFGLRSEPARLPDGRFAPKGGGSILPGAGINTGAKEVPRTPTGAFAPNGGTPIKTHEFGHVFNAGNNGIK